MTDLAMKSKEIKNFVVECVELKEENNRYFLRFRLSFVLI